MASQPRSPELGARSQDPRSGAGSLEVLRATSPAAADHLQVQDPASPPGAIVGLDAEELQS